MYFESNNKNLVNGLTGKLKSFANPTMPFKYASSRLPEFVLMELKEELEKT
jgi:hypothetical protein